MSIDHKLMKELRNRSPPINDFGALCKAIRHKYDLPRLTLAREIGLEGKTWSGLFRGYEDLNCRPPAYVVSDLAKRFNLDKKYVAVLFARQALRPYAKKLGLTLSDIDF